MQTLDSFKVLGLSDNSLDAIRRKGFEEPSPIQVQTIPLLLAGKKDIVAQAQTGTGKTAAFGLPIIEQIPEKSKNVQALVITPTRELAIQVSQELNSLKGKKRIQSLPVYGGQSYDLQVRGLKQNADIVVGTPGRVIDLIKRKILKLGHVNYLVLDEADEMLNMGFIEDVETIIESCSSDRRTLLFSATIPREIVKVARKYMGDYDLVTVKNSQLTVSLTDQIYFEVTAKDKFEALCRIIDVEAEFYGLIFCRTKVDVDSIASHLIDRGYNADALHGDLSQAQRERILTAFRRKRITILVATDVAARGIDVENLTHVINFALPHNSEAYVHRIGRTGRAGKEGTAVTFITPSEYRKLMYIQKAAKTDIRKGAMPKIRQIIRSKQKRIKDVVDQVELTDEDQDYIKLAENILEEREPVTALAATLKHIYHRELDRSQYSSIREVSFRRNTRDDSSRRKGIRDVSPRIDGQTRLFVAMGRKAGMTPRKLVTMIQSEVGVKQHRINNVEVLDDFSFISVNFKDATIILNAFKHRKGGPPSMVVKARPKRS